MASVARRLLRPRPWLSCWERIGHSRPLTTTAGSSTASNYDYVVVGGGSAGCVLANRLSANPDVRVLLLEAGGPDDAFWIHVPVGYLHSIGNPEVDWCFKTEPVPGLGGRSILYPRGKVLGGCSSINGMIYMRGQARDYDEWALTLGNRGWSWKEVLPLFIKSEDDYRGASPGHGSGGEWRVEQQRLTWEILDAFRDACEEHGIPKVDDFNPEGGDNEGSSYFLVNQRTGVRWNTSKAFLRPALARPNLTVVTHAHVTRLLLQGTRVTGVEYFVGSSSSSAVRRAHAGLETVLAAGAIGSPQLLMLSGIGPCSVLKQAGVSSLVLDVPGVGENLQDHLQLRMVFKVQGTRTLNEWYASYLGRVQMGLQYLLMRRGPLTMAPSQLGVFARSRPSQASADLEYHVQPLSLDKFGDPLHPWPAFTASVCNLRPQARGHLRIRSTDPREPPLIQPNYLSTQGDLEVAADALELTRSLALSSRALQRFQPSEHLPGPAYRTRQQLFEAAGRIGTTIFHPVGTCKMGRDPLAVVDERLRAHGLMGLRVADASIMPTITSGNTNSPVIMIAEKAAIMMHHDHGTGGSSQGGDHRGA